MREGIEYIRGAKEDAAQAQKGARYLVIHDLPLTIGQHVVRERPALGPDEGRCLGFSLMDHLMARQEGGAASVKPRQRFEINLVLIATEN
tara:strand:- start:23 stop:292 length:270 start_codon:yes stop_codon:yes gene_type:complete